MKKITFLLLGLLMMTSASADEYQYSPLVKEGKKWVEYYENTMDFTSGIIYYQFKGETEINGITYHNLYATLNSDKIANETTPIAYVREQDRKVFAIVNESNVVDFPQGYYPLEIDRCQYDASSNEFFIYDFNDITSPYDASGFAGEVNISQTDVNGQMVNIYSVPSNEIIYFDDAGMDKHEFVVQEGVGTLHEVFINPWPFYPTNGLHFNLAWVEDDGQYLYKGAFYDKAIQLVEQEYVPLVREGVVWEYVEYNSELGIHPDVASIYTLEFNGVCEEGYKLYRTDYNANGTANEPYLIAYANEANKVVTLNIDDNLPYYLNDYTIAFDKIYDYNNDELYFLPDEAIYMSYQLANVDGSVAFTVEVGNTTRKGYHVNYDAEHDIDTREFKIIEGIGVDCMYGDLFEPFRTFPTCIDGYRMSGLSAVYENGELVYQGCMFDIAQQLKNPASNGDVNGDGVVTSADVTCLYNYLLNGDSNGIVNGDQDGDGIITAADITAVYNILLGSVPESHEWVDLGLPSGTLWATMNIGASSPEEYGDYFAWGETTPKEYYEWNTYKWCMGSNNTLTKYCTNSYYGYNSFVDNDVELDPEDDAATVNWGAGWQMPTLEQIDELKDCSSSEWMTLNGVYGRLFTGSNGASLFLPAAGYRWKGTIYKAGSYGRYWSSTPRPDYPCYAYYLNFLEEYVEWIYFDRDIGFSVRAVRAPQK